MSDRFHLAVPVQPTDHVRGPHTARVTVVEYGDFECPFCRKTASDFAPVLGEFKGKYRFIRKEMPLTRIHPHALTAAKAECCAPTMG